MDDRDLRPLPRGWVWTRVGEVSLLITKGSTPTSYGFNYTPSGINFIKVENLKDGRIDRDSLSEFISEETQEFLKRSQLAENDALFSIAGTIGRVALVHHDDLPANVNQAIAIIRCPPQFIAPKYITNVLVSPVARSSIEKRPRGNGMNNVSLGDVDNILFPLPPLPEQRRIVARIEELFTRLDAGIEALNKVRTQLKRYRQSVLKSAFEGKLTAEWRQTHKGELEPASALLEKIKAERKNNPTRKGDRPRSVGAGPRACPENGSNNGQPQFENWQPHEYEQGQPQGVAPTMADTTGLPELPEGWVWTTIGKLFDVAVGGTPSRQKPEYWDGNVAWVSSGEVANGRINSTREHITDLGVQNSSAKPHPAGTVLLAMIGEGKTRGQTAILDIKAATNQNVASILCHDSGIPPQYVFFWLIARYKETRTKGSGDMQPALNSVRVGLLIIPLCPIPEQRKIVEEIERHFSVADEIEKTVEEGLKQADRLRQSILKSAFEGKLVPQDPNDEPAEKLLERIANNRPPARKRT